MDSTTMTDVPPTEPSQAPDATEDRAKPRKGRPPKRNGEDLCANLDAYGHESDEVLTWWVGVLPECPVDSIGLGGQVFMKSSDRLVRNERHPEKVRVKVAQLGNFIRVDRQGLDVIKERLRRTVVRFPTTRRPAQPGLSVPGAQLAADSATRVKRGHLITIPTPEMIEKAEKAGRPAHRYVRQSGDRPAAEFIFAQVCQDQANPICGPVALDPVSVTGMDWPKR